MSLSETLRKPKFWLIAVPVVIVLAVVVGPFVYINFIKEDAPEPLTFDDIGTTTSSVAGATEVLLPFGSRTSASPLRCSMN